MRIAVCFMIIVSSVFILTSDLLAVNYKAGNLRNPFESTLPTDIEKASKDAPMPSLTIDGLVWGSEKPQAIINDTVVQLGDEIQGAKLIDISKEGVTVIYNGKLYELKQKRKMKTGGQE